MRNLILFVLLLPSTLLAQNQKELLREGNAKYQAHNYTEADSLYRLSLNNDETNYKATFNLGDALYRQEKYADAAKQFETLAKTAETPEQKIQALHNMGNSQLQAEKPKEAIEAYKDVLRIDPKNKEARNNLALARMIQQQQEEQEGDDSDEDQDEEDQEKEDEEKKEGDKDKDKEGDNKEDQKDEENKEEEKDKDKEGESEEDKKEEDKKDQEQGKENEDKGDEKEGQAAPIPQGISKEDAQRLLESLKEQEAKLQQALQKEKGKSKSGKKIEKDW
jgi:Ca-activated chloride channel family protein